MNENLSNYNELEIQDIIDIFNNKFLYELEEYHSIDQILTYYNIPLFDTFDFDKKYNIVTQNNKIFKKPIIIHSNNLTKHKKINKLYKQFKENYKVPKSYIYDKLVVDKEFKIYNTIAEQEEYIKMWLDKSY